MNETELKKLGASGETEVVEFLISKPTDCY